MLVISNLPHCLNLATLFEQSARTRYDSIYGIHIKLCLFDKKILSFNKPIVDGFNNVGKGEQEHVGNQHFLLSPQCVFPSQRG